MVCHFRAEACKNARKKPKSQMNFVTPTKLKKNLLPEFGFKKANLATLVTATVKYSANEHEFKYHDFPPIALFLRNTASPCPLLFHSGCT